MHGGDPCQHKHQNRDRGKARRTCVPLPLLARRQHPQQTQDRQIARRQPEIDAFVNRVDGDVVRHAVVRQHVRKVQHRHAQEPAGQDDDAALRVEAARSPSHGKNEGRDNDR